MAQFKLGLTVVLDASNREEAVDKLASILADCSWEVGEVQALKTEPVVQPLLALTDAAATEEQNYVTYRVADETFRVFAKDLGLKDTELKVPKNKDFLQFRIRAFLESLGYKVEPKTNIRVVSESHVETQPQQAGETGLNSEPVPVKR